jgi:hypothetical protein
MRFIAIILFSLFLLNSFSQSYYKIVKDEIQLTDEGLNYYTKSLPSAFDLTGSEHWPPIYKQTNWVCNQVAASFYMMSYETNLRKGISSQNPANCFSIYFPWNIGNGGFGWYGDHYIITMEMMKEFGVPKFMEFPYDYPSDSSKWMTGYDLYYSAMQNRIEDYYGIRVNSTAGVTALKAWVYNHGGGDYGGTATFLANIAENGARYFPAGTPHEGAYVAGVCGDNALHARTIVGYNDNVCFDYNNDGQYTNNIDLNGDGVIDVRDWEKGGFRLAESFGPDWQGDGYMWIMYKAMADEYGSGGILNNLAHVIVPDIDYKPLLTAKFEIKHTSRERIKISVGVSSDIEAQTWEYLFDFPIFNYMGGNKYMQGGESESHKTLEAGVDITKLLEYINDDGCAKLFFVVDESDGNDVYDGFLNFCSFIDYTAENPEENISLSSPTPIVNNGRTISSTVVCVENFERPQIITEILPILSSDGINWVELENYNPTASEEWELLPYFEVSTQNQQFDMFTGTKLTPSADFDGIIDLDLPFSFPFNFKNTNKIRIHTNGYILPYETSDVWNQFRENLYPFFINEDVIAPLARFSLTTKFSDGDGIWYKNSGDTVKIRWKCADQWSEPWTNVDFGCNLISDGTIEFTYGGSILKNMYPNIGGVSFGGQSDNIICWKDNDIPAANTKVVIKPYKLPTGLFVNGNGVLYGTPAEYENYPFRVRLTTDNRVSDTKTYFLTTDVHDVNVALSAVDVFPNPIFDDVIIALNDNDSEILEICVYDVAGKIIEEKVFSKSREVILDISGYKSGLYHIKILTTNGLFVKEVVKI